MSATLVLETPDLFASPSSSQPAPPKSLLRDMADEVGNQLLRRAMQSFGSKLSLADGVALYGSQMQTGCSIYNVTHNKDGSPSQNPVKFGFTFESLVTGEQNRDAIINKTGETFSRTDDLYLARCRDGETLPHKDLNDIATFNNMYTDVVGYDANGIQHKQQLKVVKNTRELLEDRYTVSKDGQVPDEIVVPADDFERHKSNLESMAQSADSDLATRARVALQKLRNSSMRRDQTQTGAAYAHVVGQSIQDGVCRAGERAAKGILLEAGMLAVGGAVWELKDAAENPYSLSIWDRFKRFIGVLWKKLTDSSVLRLGKEAALEGVNMLLGALRNVFASASMLLSRIGEGIHTVWDAVYNYLTGKISSFSELVTVVLKTLTTIGIATLAYTLEQQFTVWGVPPIIGGLLAAALAGIAVVFANRAIDATVFTLVNMFSSVEASRIRREQIEEVCREAIPRLREKREALEASLQAYYKERADLFNSSFQNLKGALSARNTAQTCMALESLNQAFGCTLGWQTEEEFDAMMESDDPFVL